MGGQKQHSITNIQFTSGNEWNIYECYGGVPLLPPVVVETSGFDSGAGAGAEEESEGEGEDDGSDDLMSSSAK